MISRSENIDLLAQALSKAQTNFPVIHKAGKNPHFRSTYATLDDILFGIKPVLTKYGLSFSQFPVSGPEGVGLVTMLMHESGQYLEASYFIKPLKGTAQDYGSIITYFRRYALGAVLGIATDEDDDGNHASAAKPTQPNNKEVYIGTVEHKNILAKICTDLGITDKEVMKKIHSDLLEMEIPLDEIRHLIEKRA